MAPANETAPPRPLPAAVVIADDAAVHGAVIRLLSEAGIAIVTDAGDADLLLLLGAGDAHVRFDRICEIAERHAGATLLATMPADSSGRSIRRALRSGADGIVLDDQLEPALIPSLRALLAGQLALPRALRRQMTPQALSYREKQILSLVVRGLTNRQIADTLFVAESTVKTHLSSAFGKLDARSRAEAAALILDPEEGYGPAILSLTDEAPRRAA
jgi:DNA-binding NarL/FixJ family response regulator